MKSNRQALWITALSFTLVATILPHAEAGQVTIYRDRWGVPSILADEMSDALYGLGYAMAADSAERMARNYKQARGRKAEVDGPGELLRDGLLRALGIEEKAERKAGSLSEEQALLLKAFADGANRALEEQKQRLPDWIEPFTAADVLALMQFVNAAFPLLEVAQSLGQETGSNQFAVAPKRSATGHAILSIDPHLPWDWELVWYEFGLYTKDVRFRGIALVGLPEFAMGHTDRVAWCMTNNNPRLHDFYTLHVNPDNPGQYSFHGEWKEFEDVRIDLRYREGKELKTAPVTLRRTAWGPVLPPGMHALSLSMLDNWDGLDQMFRMARAKDAREFRDALSPLGLSMWNFVYADTQGNIGFQYNARVPRRSEGFDWTKPVPGDDPKTKWGTLWTIDELPHTENPGSGLLVNANSPPWLTPLGDEIRKDGWPSYVTSHGPTTRYRLLAVLLQRDKSISVKEAMRYATDTEVPYAVKTVRSLKAAAGKTDDPALKESLAVLSSWNGRADIKAKGCGLYACWYRADPKCSSLAWKADNGDAWSEEERGIALNALIQGSEEMKRQHGRPDIPWGEMHLSQRGKKTAPVSGFGYVAGDGAASIAPNSGTFRDGKITCTGGSSFRMIVDLNPRSVRSWSVLPYGNSHDPESPHYADQMDLFGRGEYKDTHFGPRAAKKAAVSEKRLERK